MGAQLDPFQSPQARRNKLKGRSMAEPQAENSAAAPEEENGAGENREHAEVNGAAATENGEASPADAPVAHLASELGTNTQVTDPISRLQIENTELRRIADQLAGENDQLMKQWETGQKEVAQVKQYLDQARRRLEQMERAAEQALNRERNLEKLVEEKSEAIAQLESHLGDRGSARQQGVLSEEELLEIQRQLEEERVLIQQERQDMEEEFKKIELNMAQERAKVARDRKDIEFKKRDLEMLIDSALRDERLKNQMGAILNLQNELKGKAVGATVRPGAGRGQGQGYPPQGQSMPGFVPPPPGAMQPTGQGFVPPPPMATFQQPLQVDPSQLGEQPPGEVPPQSPKPGGSIFRRLFKGGQ